MDELTGEIKNEMIVPIHISAKIISHKLSAPQAQTDAGVKSKSSWDLFSLMIFFL